MRGRLRIDEEMRRKLALLMIGVGIFVALSLFCRKEKGDKVRTPPAKEEGEEYIRPAEPKKEREEPKREPPEFDGKIRVVLKTDGYENIFHKSVQAEADCMLRLTDREETQIYGAGDSFSLAWEDGRVSVNGQEVSACPEAFLLQREEEGETPIRVSSIKRSQGTPSYEGNLEIWVSEKGLILVNVLPLEAYLCSVVPSEMPPGYEPEALKAQAVCARTYAYRHLQAYGYPEVYAHVDDSVRYQVYGNIARAEASDEAAADTRDEILTWEGEPITAYYFSTSCGYTGNEDIWWEGDSKKTPYLKGKTVAESGEERDLTSEKEFADFLKNPPEGGYDADVDWYRWEAEIDAEALSFNCNAALPGRYEANPEAILTKKQGRLVSSSPETLGTIRKLEVLERGESGAIQRLRITGSRKMVEVETEYNVRALLNVKGTMLTRQDGSQVEGGTLLPSACMIITSVYDTKGRLKTVRFSGGGYGHGTGMSQNGANGMAGAGKGYEEILKFFYTGADLTKLGELW